MDNSRVSVLNHYNNDNNGKFRVKVGMYEVLFDKKTLKNKLSFVVWKMAGLV